LFAACALLWQTREARASIATSSEVVVGSVPSNRRGRAVSRKAALGPLGALGGNARDSDSSDSTLSDSTSWIRWYCDLRGNEFFCEIDEEFIQDDFNLTGLAALVPNYEYALDVILDVENGEQRVLTAFFAFFAFFHFSFFSFWAHLSWACLSDDGLTEEQQEMIEAAAESLYGLIHARFILTSRGLALMLEKFHKADFGRCPRVFCHGQNVLPVGQSDIPRVNTAKVFCPRCRDLYFPKYSRHANVDGAYFGTTFPHLLMQTYPELVVPRPTQAYVPRSRQALVCCVLSLAR